MVKRCAAWLWKRETGVLCPDLVAGWSEEQRELFNNDWNHDSFLDGLKDFPDCQTPEPTIPEKVCDHSQTGKGSRKRAVESSTESTPRKRSKTAPLFTICKYKACLMFWCSYIMCLKAYFMERHNFLSYFSVDVEFLPLYRRVYSWCDGVMSLYHVVTSLCRGVPSLRYRFLSLRYGVQSLCCGVRPLCYAVPPGLFLMNIHLFLILGTIYKFHTCKEL